MNQTWARYIAPAVANHGSSTPRFSRPPRNGGSASIVTGRPVIAAPHHAAFQEITGWPKNAPMGPAGMSN